MVTCTALQKVREGKEADLTRLMQELTENVRAHEPGCTLFLWVRSKTAPRAYLVIEQYVDDRAWEFHRDTDYLKAVIPHLMTCLERDPELAMFEAVE